VLYTEGIWIEEFLVILPLWFVKIVPFKIEAHMISDIPIIKALIG
jgi:hypothetical protein